MKTLIDNTSGQCCLFLDSSSFFSTRLTIFFRLKFQNFDLSLKSWHWPRIFLFVNIHFANLDSYFLNCIRCILQVSTCVLCFQHVFAIGIILFRVAWGGGGGGAFEWEKKRRYQVGRNVHKGGEGRGTSIAGGWGGGKQQDPGTKNDYFQGYH